MERGLDLAPAPLLAGPADPSLMARDWGVEVSSGADPVPGGDLRSALGPAKPTGGMKKPRNPQRLLGNLHGGGNRIPRLGWKTFKQDKHLPSNQANLFVFLSAVPHLVPFPTPPFRAEGHKRGT